MLSQTFHIFHQLLAMLGLIHFSINFNHFQQLQRRVITKERDNGEDGGWRMEDGGEDKEGERSYGESVGEDG